MENSVPERKHYNLSDISRSLGKMIEKHYNGKYWVKAEIAKLNFYPKSGHCYPDLVEQAEGRIKVQMRATIWRHHYKAIQRKFEYATKEELKTGLNVLFLVEVKYDGVHGLSLNILDVDPSLSMGEMAKEKWASIHRLKEEKVFDLNRNLELPLLPKRLAIISVSTSKGYQDFMNIIAPVQKKYGIFTMLFSALLQGDNAISSIGEQLHKIAQVKEHFDAILIIRGGGGDVGLQAYNNYELARNIAITPIPVLTGIGHASNRTVSDMVAFKDVITPTDLAYYFVEKFEIFDGYLQYAGEKIIQYAKTSIETHQKQVEYFKQGLFLHSQSVIQTQKSEIQQLRNIIPLLVKQRVSSEKDALKLVLEKINLLSPEHVLRRGYSITFHQGKVVVDAAQLKEGEEIITQFYQGEVRSQVIIEEDKIQ